MNRELFYTFFKLHTQGMCYTVQRKSANKNLQPNREQCEQTSPQLAKLIHTNKLITRKKHQNLSTEALMRWSNGVLTTRCK